jgi:hypothetical protein
MIRMSNRIRAQFAGLIGLVSAVAGAASAVPLTYTVVQAESNVFTKTVVTSTIDVNPDFTNTFPFTEPLQASSNTQPSGQSNLIADVGLPGGFDDGANGINFSALKIHVNNLPGTLVGTSAVPVPLGVTGSPVLYVTATATIGSFQIVLNSPFSSTLTPSANPNEWLWSGLADVTISGTLNPQYATPAPALPVALPSTPFSQNVQLPLAGTFSGVPTGTRVIVGLTQDALQNQDLSLPPITGQFDLGDLGLVTLSYDIHSLILEDIATSVVYQNALPIPEPSTALLVGLGLLGLALRRSR